MFATRGGVSYKSVTQKLYFIVAVWALGRRQEDWVGYNVHICMETCEKLD